MENVLNLDCGLVEMSQVELQETDGGVHPALVVAACVGGGVLGLAVGIGVCYLAYKYL
jgi:lactobin A/cerein 7B family class IIb bacteriocin